LTIYKSGWDTLVANKDNRTFRQQVAFKFMPEIQEIKKSPKDNKLTKKLASFAKISLLIPFEIS